MTTPERMPVLFVGHGSPMNALEDNPFTRAWAELGRRLPRPRAILVISAHWETKGVLVTAAAQQRTIHDFYGFPPALFAMQYNPPGDPALAQEIAALLAPVGRADADSWGLDHGAWAVLNAMYPAQDIPVLQLSMDARLSPEGHYRIGQALKPLRDRGVLIIGSGDIVHNLRLFDWRPGAATPAWAVAFNERVKAKIAEGDDGALIDYRALPDVAKAFPDPDHYHPLLYVLGARDPDERIEFLTDEVMSSLSMTSVLFGAN
ncbi:MAG TPA: 4,5-DOPA dioxygenase extradiol [Caulobacteraceae bacterium]|nr:4,5-DOPA dioxygenase extradiol [Caulobacteraceae bacterium]